MVLLTQGAQGDIQGMESTRVIIQKIIVANQIIVMEIVIMVA